MKDRPQYVILIETCLVTLISDVKARSLTHAVLKPKMSTKRTILVVAPYQYHAGGLDFSVWGTT